MVLEETALAAAKQAEQEIAAGRWRGPLHGIPIGLRDIYNTAGVRATVHSALFKDHIPTEDAATVTLPRQAGAIVLGKLATLEFAIGGASFDLLWRWVRYPWNNGARSRMFVVRLGRSDGSVANPAMRQRITQSRGATSCH
jgi:aspartyl-tRNA(Asn)/glutamyl-tRNA(Gln) amidotransferase subunit A